MSLRPSLLLLAACWQTKVAPPAPPVASRSEPPRLIVGAGVVSWDGDHLEPAQIIQFAERDERDLSAGLEFALVGCAGLLGRARLTEAAEPGWRFEIVARATLWTPTRTCRIGETIAVFAVSPPERVHDGGRGEADQRALYDSLPRRYRQWHERTGVVPGTGTVSLWADLDADDVVDLVELTGPCDAMAPDACTVILSRDAGSWRRIGGTAPL